MPSHEGCRLPLNEGLLPANQLAQISGDDPPPSLQPITGPSSLRRGSPPPPTHRYFRPRGGSRLHLFPWHRRQGSHVPYRSLIELRAAYTPDAARSVSGHPPSLSRRNVHPAVLTSPNPISTLQKQFACARLSRSCLRPDVSATLTTVAFDHNRSRWLGISDLIAEPKGPSFISSTVARRRVDRRCS
jgi:hypothetical protein